jgi:hypothetical protein
LAYLQPANSAAPPLQASPAVSMLPDWLGRYPPAAPLSDASGALVSPFDAAFDSAATTDSDPANAYPNVTLVGGEDWEKREEDEHKKFEAEVLGGLSGKGLSESPKALPTLPSLPPLEAPPKLDFPPAIGPGPYAGEPIPAGPRKRPSTSQQDRINASGDKFGCHTCGLPNPGTPKWGEVWGKPPLLLRQRMPSNAW